MSDRQSALFKESGEICAVTLLYRMPLGGHFVGLLPGELEWEIMLLVWPARHRLEKRIIDQGCKHGEGGAHHFGACLSPESSNKSGQLPEDALLLAFECPLRVVEHGPDVPVAVGHLASAAEEVEVALDV